MIALIDIEENKYVFVDVDGDINIFDLSDDIRKNWFYAMKFIFNQDNVRSFAFLSSVEHFFFDNHEFKSIYFDLTDGDNPVIFVQSELPDFQKKGVYEFIVKDVDNFSDWREYKEEMEK